MTPLDIKIELMKAGVTQAEIARRAGCCRWHISRVIAEPDKGAEDKRVAIASAINRTPQQVWPDYYGCANEKACA